MMKQILIAAVVSAVVLTVAARVAPVRKAVGL